MDNLEKYIIENREAFDSAVPNLKVWADIDEQLSRKSARRIPIRRILSIAATIVVLLVAGAAAGSYIANGQQGEEITSLADVSPEYAELEQHYDQQIKEKTGQLAVYNHDKTVDEDLQQIDNVMDELLLELQNAPEGQEEQIISNMVKNYQAKIDILERVLERIQSINQKSVKTERDEISI
ncbi:MAG: hypothetical protein GY705_19660 [Bacteroidetes bacterium]|nr:hypothetical protein [Bacteroidota bacterium]